VPHERISDSSSTEGLPITTAMGPAMASVAMAQRATITGTHDLLITSVAVLIGLGAGIIAKALIALIGLITNLSFFGRFSIAFTSPAGNHLGLWVLVIPVIGGVIVGLMARYGSEGIRGHGIPEVIEKILQGQSRIAPRLTFLKPLSGAIAIGTGGPFGAEGPVIATGGALGSLVGQLMDVTAEDRKILLAAGGAAGMTAVFGSPISGVLLAIELLLFEFSARSLIPVMFASAAGMAMHIIFFGAAPIFSMPEIMLPTGKLLVWYAVVGLLVGAASVLVTRTVFLVEDTFQKLPIPWMWWPAIGGIFIGIFGYIAPDTLGVGYGNIRGLLSGSLTQQALIVLGVFKFLSWSISLGSGTSGGTLAPLFTIGGALGAVIGNAGLALYPGMGIDPRVAGLVGMTAMFTGASRAVLTSMVFAIETTQRPAALLPVIGGCAVAYLMSSMLMANTIMTEKIARRGVRPPTDYEYDFSSQVLVREAASYGVISLPASTTLAEFRSWLAQGRPGYDHHAFPVIAENGELLGMITGHDIVKRELPGTTRVGDIAKHSWPVALESHTLREASDLMVNAQVGCLPVVSPDNPHKLLAVLSHRDLMLADRRRLAEESVAQQSIHLSFRS
jgi:H+/Cl- antiporter ClcA